MRRGTTLLDSTPPVILQIGGLEWCLDLHGWCWQRTGQLWPTLVYDPSSADLDRRISGSWPDLDKWSILPIFKTIQGSFRS